MNIGIIIQARLGSTRLPGKILKEFYGGKTLLETVIKVTEASHNDQKVLGDLNSTAVTSQVIKIPKRYNNMN